MRKSAKRYAHKYDKSWKLLFINVNYAFSFQLFRGHGHCVLIRSHFKSMLQPFWLVFSAPTSTHSMHTIEIKIKHFFGLFFSLGFSFTSVALNTINFNSLKIYDRQFIIISLLGWWRSVRKFCAPFNKLLSATNIHSDNYYYWIGGWRHRQNGWHQLLLLLSFTHWAYGCAVNGTSLRHQIRYVYVSPIRSDRNKFSFLIQFFLHKTPFYASFPKPHSLHATVFKRAGKIHHILKHFIGHFNSFL